MTRDEPATSPCPSFVSHPGEFATGPDSICATCAESGASHGITTYGPPTQIARELREATAGEPDTCARFLGQAAALLIESLEGPDDYDRLTEHLRTVAHERWWNAASDWVERYRRWVDE